MSFRILIVDDNRDMRLLLRYILEDQGLAVSEANGGADALEILDDGPRPDVVILDVQMPEMDGWETLGAIRHRAPTKDLPVVLCTVKARPADVVHGWEIGCDGYIVKPFDTEALAAEIWAVASRNPEDRLKIREIGLVSARRWQAEIEAGLTRRP